MAMFARARSVVLAVGVVTCSPAQSSPTSPTPRAPPVPVVASDGSAAQAAPARSNVATPLADGAADGAGTAGTAPEAPEPEPEPPTASFDPQTAPRSKMALIAALDAGLRSGNKDKLLGSVPDGGPMLDACRARVYRTGAAAAQRISLEDGMLACRDLADWTRARRVVLNFGARERPFATSCTELNALEKSELFYAIDDRVLKVTLKGVSSRGGYAATAVSCVKKRGSPRELERLRVNCPGRTWTRVTHRADAALERALVSAYGAGRSSTGLLT